MFILCRKNGHATNTAVEIDGRREANEDEFEQDDDGKIIDGFSSCSVCHFTGGVLQQALIVILQVNFVLLT